MFQKDNIEQRKGTSELHMIIRCDECGRLYEQIFDDHDMGEPNFCCEHCLWKASHTVGEPQPAHTCKEIKLKEKVSFT